MCQGHTLISKCALLEHLEYTCQHGLFKYDLAVRVQRSRSRKDSKERHVSSQQRQVASFLA